MRAVVLAIGVQCLLASVAQAQPAPAKGEGVAYFVGRWQVAARDPGAGEVLQVAYVVEATPGGAWAAGSGVSTDGTLNSRDMWGRDPLTGELIRVIFDGGGTFATIRSPGWQGDKLVLEGEARSTGGTIRVRESITRITPHRFQAVWEAWRDGKWVAYSVESVTRQT